MLQHKMRVLRLPAFGLMEIAIVLVIIGIIAGFALKGSQLIDHAKLKTVITDVEQIRLATLMFQEKHHSLPGDCASKILQIGKGNGNGIIDGSGLSTPSGETALFWNHLAETELMPSLKAEKNVTPIAGIHFPRCKIGGTITIASTIKDKGGPWIVLGEINSGSISGGLTPLQASEVDTHNDDGDPNSGLIQAVDGTAQNGACIQNNTYQTASKTKACILLFKL